MDFLTFFSTNERGIKKREDHSVGRCEIGTCFSLINKYEKMGGRRLRKRNKREKF
jgi:hypothetical protein